MDILLVILLKLTLRDQDYSNIIIEEIKFIIVITIKDTRSS